MDQLTGLLVSLDRSKRDVWMIAPDKVFQRMFGWQRQNPSRQIIQGQRRRVLAAHDENPGIATIRVGEVEELLAFGVLPQGRIHIGLTGAQQV